MATDRNHENEYDQSVITMLECIWGEGYMAPGGAGNVQKMLSALSPEGKTILDIGNGLGGPAIEMAKSHGAHVIGLDLESPLITHATEASVKHQANQFCKFVQVTPGPLHFSNDSFDIVTSSGAFTQIKDKTSLFREIHRVLKPGGWVSAYDWMKISGEYSKDMRYWFETEGLTYEMVTQSEQNPCFVRQASKK